MQYKTGITSNHAVMLVTTSFAINLPFKKKKGKTINAKSIIDPKNKVCPQTNFPFFSFLCDCFFSINFERKYTDITKEKMVNVMISMKAIDLAIISVIETLKMIPKKNTRFQRLSLFHRSFINFLISESST